MTVTRTVLTANHDTATNGLVITTASISPAANKPLLAIIVVNSSATINTPPIITGGGLTWELITQTVAAARITCAYRAITSSPTPDIMTITSGDGQNILGAFWGFIQFDGALATGANAVDAFINPLNARVTATSASRPFLNAVTPGNATYSCVSLAVTETPTAGTGWTADAAFQHTAPNTGAVFMWAQDAQQNVNATWVTSNICNVIGIEVVAAPVQTGRKIERWNGTALTPLVRERWNGTALVAQMREL